MVNVLSIRLPSVFNPLVTVLARSSEARGSTADSLSTGASSASVGVDVGAAAQIHNEILALKAGGCAILIVSEELDELFALCDRLHVIANGRLSPSTPTHATNREQIGLWMSGMWDKAPASAAATSEVAHG